MPRIDGVADLLVADCEEAWFHPEEEHMQKMVSAGGGAGLLYKITKPTAWRGKAQILKKEEEDARLLDRCEAKRKEWAKHWQCFESVQNAEDKPWENEDLKKLEEALPSLKECDRKKCRGCIKQKQE